MSDDVKKAVEWLRTLDVDDRGYAEANTLLAHIDGEPARLAAAREEQREADALYFGRKAGGLLCRGTGRVEVTRGTSRGDVQKWSMKCRGCPDCIRATPLTATPLKDELESMRKHMSFVIQNCQDYMAQVETLRARVKELERELEQAKASETVAWSDCEPTRQGPYGTVYVHDGCGACARCVDAALAERDAALARVKELEATLRRERDLFKETFFTSADKRAEKAEAERDAALLRVNSLQKSWDIDVKHLHALAAERDELRQRILDSCPSPDEGGRIHAGGRIVCGQCHDSEVSHLRAQLAEATSEGTLSARIGVVREALGMSEFDSATEVGPINALKAQIAEAEHELRELRVADECGPATDSPECSRGAEADWCRSCLLARYRLKTRELAEAVAVLRKVTEALEGSFPGDESVGWPEFPEVSMSQAWTRRMEARAFLAKHPEGK